MSEGSKGQQLSSFSLLGMNSTSSSKKTKRVHFAAGGVNYIALAPNQQCEMDGYSSATWYSSEEYDGMKGEVRDTVKAMRRNRSIPDTDDVTCTRGLEHLRSSVHLEQQVINKDCVIEAVLAEQERQNKAGVYDCIELSNASMAHSRWARDAATTIAATDEAFVRVSASQSCLHITRSSRRVNKSQANPRTSSSDKKFTDLQRALQISSLDVPLHDNKKRNMKNKKLALRQSPLWLCHQDSRLKITSMASVSMTQLPTNDIEDLSNKDEGLSF